MRRWLQLVLACVLILAVLTLCIAPAYAIFPCALRAWNSAWVLFFVLCTLIVYAYAAPLLAEGFVAETWRDRAGGDDPLRLTCTLQI